MKIKKRNYYDDIEFPYGDRAFFIVVIPCCLLLGWWGILLAMAIGTVVNCIVYK